MKNAKEKIIQYARTAWKWIGACAGSKTVRWLANTVLVPLILKIAANNGITLPLEIVREIVAIVTGQAIDLTSAAIGVGAMIAAGGTALANDTWESFKRTLRPPSAAQDRGNKV